LFGDLNKNKNSVTGVGLGLSYCKMVTQCMGGDIECRSNPKQGTIFDFYVNVDCKHEDKGLSSIENSKF
jgi:K+-sensing histidine kinase KdpD